MVSAIFGKTLPAGRCSGWSSGKISPVADQNVYRREWVTTSQNRFQARLKAVGVSVLPPPLIFVEEGSYVGRYARVRRFESDFQEQEMLEVEVRVEHSAARVVTRRNSRCVNFSLMIRAMCSTTLETSAAKGTSLARPQ